MTLEREIYSIESANINKETLEAMKNASKAMQTIHAGVTVDKVEDIMYVTSLRTLLPMQRRLMLTGMTGTDSATSTRSAKKSTRPLLALSEPKKSTRTSLTQNLQISSKNNSTRRCSRPVKYPLATRLAAYRRLHNTKSRARRGWRKTTKRRSWRG